MGEAHRRESQPRESQQQEAPLPEVPRGALDRGTASAVLPQREVQPLRFDCKWRGIEGCSESAGAAARGAAREEL